MTRVLHLINAFQPGGIETWLLRMLAVIPRQEVAMDFICKGADTGLRADVARQHGASVQHCPLRPLHTEFIGGILSSLRTGNYDIVHSHLDVTGGPGVWAARYANVPVISSFHNTHFAPQTWTRAPGVRQLRAVYSKFSIGYSLRKSNMITGCSKAVLENVVPEHEEDSRCRVLHYGVESHARASDEQRNALRRELNLADDSPLVLHVGRLATQKNHAGLLRIFAKVVERVPNAALILAGEGPLRPIVETQVAALGLENKVQLLGMRSDVPRLMTCSDVLLFPSFHEGLPVVSLESCACELPLVGSNIAGTNESILHGKTGLLHAVEDEDGMAESTIEVLTQPERAAKIRAAATARIDEHFSRTASANSLRKLYSDTLKQFQANGNRPVEARRTTTTKKAA